jgi:hypothetical protein
MSVFRASSRDVGTEFIFLVFCIFVECDHTLWNTYSCKRTLSFSSSLIFKGKAPMNKERGADQRETEPCAAHQPDFI